MTLPRRRSSRRMKLRSGRIINTISYNQIKDDLFLSGEVIRLRGKKAIAHITSEGNTYIVVYFYPDGKSIMAKARGLGIRNVRAGSKKYHFELDTFSNSRYHPDSNKFSPTVAKKGMATKQLCKFFKLFKRGGKYHKHKDKIFLVRTGYIRGYWEVHGRDKFSPTKLQSFYKNRLGMESIGDNFQTEHKSESESLLITTPRKLMNVCKKLIRNR